MSTSPCYPCVSTRPAFTLVELLIVNAAIVVILGLLQPSVGRARGSARDLLSQSNMRLLGTGGAYFASDHAGSIFRIDSNLSTGQTEAIDIISRLTGRPIESGTEDELERLLSITPNRRYQHLVLFDYLNLPFPNQFIASPFDRNLLTWQQDPVLAQGTTVPHVNDCGPVGTDSSCSWINSDVLQLWPYASTYQIVPAAWNPNNNDGPYTSSSPISSTPHLFRYGAGQPRGYGEVAFPSQKVHMFEEFDRLGTPNGLWFAYPSARCNLLFFDGSVRNLPTYQANPGWNPAEPTTDWVQRYKPFDTFPTYAEGYSSRDRFSMRYRWTRQGLGGLDYGLNELSDNFSRTDD